MALRAVADHPKLARLKGILGCGRGEAMGYLEALWHFAAKFTPRGNIGKYLAADVEAWIEWGGPTGTLMAAMRDSGWLDVHSEHGLVIHDWYQHADDAVDMKLARSAQFYATGETPRMNRLGRDEKELLKSQFAVLCEQRAQAVRTECTEIALPEPEPVARAGSQKPVPEPEPVPVCATDPGWIEFERLARSVNMLGSEGQDGDWDKACRIWWPKMSFENQLALMDLFRKRIQNGDYDDPAYVPGLSGFFTGKWRNPLRPKPNGKPKLSAVEVQRRAVLEKMAQEAKEIQ